MNCRDHPLEPLIFVCIAQHKCQRKLCASCQYLHEADRKKILPNQLFLDQIQKKAQLSKLNQNFEQQRVLFKEFLSNAVIIFQKKIEEIFECINKIYQMIEQEDQFFDALVETRVQVSELSYQYLDLMVNLLQNDRLYNWNQQKQSYVQQLDILKSWLKDETKQFIDKVNQNFQGIFGRKKLKNIKDQKWFKVVQQRQHFKLIRQKKENTNILQIEKLYKQFFITICSQNHKLLKIQKKLSVYNGLENMAIILRKQDYGQQNGREKKYRDQVDRKVRKS